MFKVFLVIVLLLSSMLQFSKDLFWPKDQKITEGLFWYKDQKIITGIILLALIITSILLSFFIQQSESKQADSLNESLNSQLEHLKKDNYKLSQELAKNTTDINNNITGGDSFCYIKANIPSIEKPFINYALVHSGKNPMYDVKLQIEDIGTVKREINKYRLSDDYSKENDTIFFSELVKENTVIKDIGFLPNNSYHSFKTFTISNDYILHWRISIFARNGYFTQEIKIINLEEKKPISANIVSKNNAIIYKYVEPAFPRKEDGTIKWN